MSLKIRAAVYSHIGNRSNNEDNFYFNGQFMKLEQMNRGAESKVQSTDDLQIYAICDGMGGAEFGEEASFCAVEALKEYHQNCEQPDSTVYLNDLADNISRRIDNISTSRNMPSGTCGSTITMLLLRDWYFRTLNVGDSRIYRLRAGKLECMTHDDSEVQRLLDTHRITPEEAWMHPRKNVILKHLGMPLKGGKLVPTISERMDLHIGDRFVICSDGLSDVVKDENLRQMLIAESDPNEMTIQLARTALKNANGYGIASDNVTVIVLDVLDVTQRNETARRIGNMKLLRNITIGAMAAGAAGFIYFLIDLLRYVNR